MSRYDMTNIVTKEKLREVQLNTLQILYEVVSKTKGPYGSNTQLIHEQRIDEYTKDGHKVLSEVKFYNPLENAIQQEMKKITAYIEKKVGDGTTTAVELSYRIFKNLCELESYNEYPPYEIINTFKEVVKEISDSIYARGRECTIEDIYKISMISTNGNEEVSRNISDIYKSFGLDVFIDVGISNTEESILKTYDGLTLDAGYASAAFINNDGRTSIRNPRIYAFADPIDTPEMLAFFTKIVDNNIIQPYVDMSTHVANGRPYIPTVIIAPSISRDALNTLKELESMLYQIEKSGINKPPILIVTHIENHMDQFEDITMLCGCKSIIKYINPDTQKKDIENGKAPDLDTIVDWYGSADMVEADTTKTKFINPKDMFVTNEDGEREYSSVYSGLTNFLKQQLDEAYRDQQDCNVTGNLKRRLNSLKTNMVDYLVGGITVTDRDSVRDLVEDAVLNCRSAAKNGVGYGSYLEGYFASEDVFNNTTMNPLKESIAKSIYESYADMLEDLYNTSTSVSEIKNVFDKVTEDRVAYNVVTKEYGDTVLCTIDTDPVILDMISKVIMIMLTSNQALLPSPLNNVYLKD